MQFLLLQLTQNSDLLDSGTGFPWIDKLGTILLLLFFALGFFRGLWWQMIRLGGIAASVLAARSLSPSLEPLLTDVFGISDSRFSQGIAWILIFMTGLVATLFVGRMGNSLLKSLQLGVANRVAGGIAGLVTALVVHSALLASLSLLAPRDWFQAELDGSQSSRLLEVLARRWPVIVDTNHSQWIGDNLIDSATQKVR